MPVRRPASGSSWIWNPSRSPVETAVPCGLILNELVTNAFKHAFRGRAEGEVTVGVAHRTRMAG